MTTRNLTIHQGAVAPYQLELVVGSAKGGFDLTLATAGVIEVLPQSSRNQPPYTEWAATLETAGVADDGSTQVTLVHVYEAGDVPKPGTIYVRAKITHPEGELFSAPVALVVARSF